MNSEENLRIIENWMDAMNRYDLEEMESFYTDDAVADEVPEPEVFAGKKAITEAYRELFYAFPDCKSAIINRVTGGDQVLFEIIWEGTHKEEFRGIPGTDKVVKLRIAYLFKLHEGKISRIIEYYDAATILQQLDLLPEE
ncbi:MAG: ester cyclase [Candidatus Heimdallarchaeota archaeon]